MYETSPPNPLWVICGKQLGRPKKGDRAYKAYTHDVCGGIYHYTCNGYVGVSPIWLRPRMPADLTDPHPGSAHCELGHREEVGLSLTAAAAALRLYALCSNHERHSVVRLLQVFVCARGVRYPYFDLCPTCVERGEYYVENDENPYDEEADWLFAWASARQDPENYIRDSDVEYPTPTLGQGVCQEAPR